MTIPVTKILLVEDNLGDARLLREALAEIPGPRFELIHSETLARGLEFLAMTDPDVVLLDLGLPDAQGLEAVRRTHTAAPAVPIVVLTALNDDTVAIQSLQVGAQDYLCKAHISGGLLWNALRYAMERQRVQLEMLNLARIDDLTGLNNRRGFLALAEHHSKVAYRTGKPFLVAFIDLDRLKHVNDTFGHQEGNRALVDATNVLKDSFRQCDILARLGGDEFAVLIIDAGEDSIEVVHDRIQRKLSTWNANAGRRYDLSLSVGIAAADVRQIVNIERLLSQADALMYEQKQAKGRSRELAGTSRSGKQVPSL
jgi:diguanylate cyclase (GGDEF)-like protein